jgi:hypothetical protein
MSEKTEREQVQVQAKPLCAVQGLIRRGAMCSQIIVGGKLCGYSGKCEHQRAAAIGQAREQEKP